MASLMKSCFLSSNDIVLISFQVPKSGSSCKTFTLPRSFQRFLPCPRHMYRYITGTFVGRVGETEMTINNPSVCDIMFLNE